MTDAWNRVRAELAGSADAPANIAEWALTRHVRRGAGDRIALRWRPPSGPARVYSYSDVEREAARFAAGLASLGIGDGAAVVIRLGPVPELAVALLGAMRAGAVPTVVAPSAGEAAVRSRLELSASSVLVASTAGLRADFPRPRHAFAVMAPGSLAVGVNRDAPPDGWTELGTWLADQEAGDPAAPVEPDAPAYLVPSDTGSETAPLAVVGHDAVVALAATARSALGIEPSSRVWIATPHGEGLGEGYGLLAALTLGATSFLDETSDAGRMVENLVSEGIQVLLAPGTVLRGIADGTHGTGQAFTHLRSLAVTGVPLAAEDVARVKHALRLHPRAVWAEPETGAIVLAPPLPGSEGEVGTWGVPVDGFDVTTVVEEADGVRRASDDEPGRIGVRAPWPSMFRGFRPADPGGYEARFRDGWYVSRQEAVRDGEGRFRPPPVT